MMRPQRGKQRKEKVKAEYEQKLIDLRRVARVVAGGRRFSFRATLVIGNRAGDVGIGTAKGVDTASSIEKAYQKAKKNMIKVSLTDTGTISHEVMGKYAASYVLMRPAKQGKGLMAGGSVRAVCDLAGVQNVTTKVLSRSTNRLNNAMATLTALKHLKPARKTKKEEPQKETVAA